MSTTQFNTDADVWKYFQMNVQKSEHMALKF